ASRHPRHARRRDPAERLRRARARRSDGWRVPDRSRDLSARRPADDGRPDEHGQLTRAARAVLRPPPDRGQPHDSARDEDPRAEAQGAPQERVRLDLARAGARPPKAGVHDPTGGLARRRPARHDGRAPRAGAGAGAWPLRGGGGRAPQGRAPRGNPHARRSALDAHDDGGLDPRVPGPARPMGAGVTRALREEPADVLHVHQPFAGYGALGSRPARHVPTLYSFYSPAPLEYRARRRMTAHHHGGWTGELGVVALWAIERACLRRAGLIHVLSDFSAAQLWRLYRIPREPPVRNRGAVP